VEDGAVLKGSVQVRAVEQHKNEKQSHAKPVEQAKAAAASGSA